MSGDASPGLYMELQNHGNVVSHVYLNVYCMDPDTWNCRTVKTCWPMYMYSMNIHILYIGYMEPCNYGNMVHISSTSTMVPRIWFWNLRGKREPIFKIALQESHLGSLNSQWNVCQQMTLLAYTYSIYHHSNDSIPMSMFIQHSPLIIRWKHYAVPMYILDFYFFRC